MSLADELKKTFGDARKTKAQKAKFFSTGFPPLNKIISGSYSGGVPQGQILEIHGPSQSGKTHLCTEIMKSAQQQGGCAMFVDWERRFKIDFAERRGLIVDPPQFIHTLAPTWEDGNAAGIRFAEMVRKSGEFDESVPIVIVLDSIAAAIPKSMLEDKSKTGEATYDRAKSLEYNMSDMTALARVTSTTLKVIAHYAREYNTTFVYTNQVRTKPNISYGDPTTTPGGSAAEFYADCRISLSRAMDKDGSKEVVGQTVTAKTVKNAITRPLQKVSWVLNFMDDGDTVFDRESSLVEYCASMGLIPSPTKGYLEYPIGSGNKVRKSALIEAAKQSTAAYESLLELLKD